MGEPTARPIGPMLPEEAGALRADLETGLRFLHTMAMQSRSDIFEIAVRLIAVMELLVERGGLDHAQLDDRVDKVRARESERVKDQAMVKVLPAPDKYTLDGLPDVPCADLIPLCKGRCCRLEFPLAFQDLDEGVVKWDYARPYMIRRKPDSYCHHSDDYTRSCTVYDHRPAVCRSYDCRQDKRIWADFERRIPAPEHEEGSYVRIRVDRKGDD